MPQAEDMALLVKLLIGATGALTAAIAFMFYQLLAANAREVEAYKVCAPLVQKLTELCEKLTVVLSRRGSDNGGQA